MITSVDRDDLPNGGAEAFAGCITEIRRRLPDTSVEVLIPDFKGSERALRIVMDARPDILNHNLETAERLYRLARPGGRYDRALALLANARRMDPAGADQERHHPRHGRGVGRGARLHARPAPQRRQHPHAGAVPAPLRQPPARRPILHPDEFAELRDLGLAMGFAHVQASPLTRSSYHAWEQVAAAARRDVGRDGVSGGDSVAERR